jgi:hypothetical protein
MSFPDKLVGVRKIYVSGNAAHAALDVDHEMSRSIEVYNEEFNGHGEMHPYF